MEVECRLRENRRAAAPEVTLVGPVAPALLQAAAPHDVDLWRHTPLSIHLHLVASVYHPIPQAHLGGNGSTGDTR